MNFRKLIQLATDDGFDTINIHAIPKGLGVRVSFETRKGESAAVSLFELPTVKFDRHLLRQAVEERDILVGAGWDISFDEKSLRLRRLTMSEILSVFDDKTDSFRAA